MLRPPTPTLSAGGAVPWAGKSAAISWAVGNNHRSHETSESSSIVFTPCALVLRGFWLTSISLGQATLAFGWILVIAQLAYIVFLIVYLAKGHGFAQQTLRQSFHDLSEYGGSGTGTGGGVIEKPTELSSVPAPAPVTTATV